MSKYLQYSICSIIFLAVSVAASASIVSVHDPSIVIAYKDSFGNSHPENDAARSREKYYYVFGTQFGAAYSTDMINWTYKEPKFTMDGKKEASCLEVFKDAAAWSGHTTKDALRGNAWAADVIYNKDLKKWCMYYSVNGDDWKSSIVMLTSDQIDGLYQYAGVVVCGGMNNSTTGIGNDDYEKALGTSTIDSRYFKNPDDAKSTSWHGHYGASCIDPNVLYDEEGQLWLLYGSWSGGLFMIQLDNKTGLRNYNYKYGNEPVWAGTTLKSDPYMGIHIGGGYYVSGEGAYIEYMKDPDGNGYYYLFVSYGFYSPEGGYVMRMFRSENITGPYVDTNGDTPLFDKYVFNYGNNLSRGVPVMQNYKWSWFGDGQTAQGHNSALMDEDGKCYLVYHTKFDNGTIFHNVEVHPMLFNRNGWPLSTPFEHRVGYGQPDEAISREEIVGAYGVIYHGAVKYANLECNEEQTIYLNTDGSISGAYTGSWEYDYSNGRHFLTIKTPTTTFDGCFTYQLMDSISTHTLSFTSLNSEGQNVFWGYKKTFTEKLTTKEYEENEIVVGDTTYSIFWMDVDKFHKDTVVGDFEIEYLFHNKSKGEHNWENWGLGLRIGESQWYLRGDAYSNQILTGSTVGYHSSGTPDYLTVFQDKDVRLNIKRQGASITVFAYADDEYVFSATSYDSPMGGGVVSLCAEAAVVDVKSITKGLLAERETVGITNADGTYTSAFNQEKNSYDALEGDFEVEFDFRNYRHPESKNNWDNFIVRMISDDNTMLIRSDAYAMDVEGSLTYNFDWQWNDFIDIMKGAIVKMNVKRNDDVITYSITYTTTSHDVFHYNIVQLNAPKTNMRIGFTCEKSMIDILRYEQFFRKQKREEEFETNIDETSKFNPAISVRHGVLYVNAETNCKLSIFDLMGRLVCNVDLMKGENEIRGLDNGVYIVNHQKIVVW